MVEAPERAHPAQAHPAQESRALWSLAAVRAGRHLERVEALLAGRTRLAAALEEERISAVLRDWRDAAAPVGVAVRRVVRELRAVPEPTRRDNRAKGSPGIQSRVRDVERRRGP